MDPGSESTAVIIIDLVFIAIYSVTGAALLY